MHTFKMGRVSINKMCGYTGTTKLIIRAEHSIIYRHSIAQYTRTSQYTQYTAQAQHSTIYRHNTAQYTGTTQHYIQAQHSTICKHSTT